VKLRAGTLAGRIRPTRFGEMLRLYRMVRGQTLRDIRNESGVNHATLMRIEYGQSYDVKTFLKLWQWLHQSKSEPLPAPPPEEP